jgi:hypothetical protein
VIQRFHFTDHGAMIVLVILTHGDKDIFFAKDLQKINKNWILQQFTTEECPGLHGTPKLFIFQACRLVAVIP